MIDFETVQFRNIQAGYWTVVVNGVDFPVVAVRKGRNWYVQAADTRRTAKLEKVHGVVRRLRDAKSLMVAAWLAIQSERDLAHLDALEIELRRLNEKARELGVTYPILPAGTTIEDRVTYVKALLNKRFTVLHGPKF